MAKKQKTQTNVTHVEDTKVNVTQVIEQPKVETPVMEIPEPKAKETKKPKNEWEIKDRIYYLKGSKRKGL